jgi:signal transduction histidine kinase
VTISAPAWDRAKHLVASWRGDVLLGGLTVAWAAGYQAVAGPPGSHDWTILVFALPYGGALAVRSRWPAAAAAIGCAALVVIRPIGLEYPVNRSLVIVAWTPFLLTYALGARSRLLPGLAGVMLLTVGLQAQNPVFNPFLEMLTLGPWLAGRIVASRRRLTEQLEVRNAELAAEREAFARESVRYERARIARELHDIVAHGVSVIVVQAGAAQRAANAVDGADDASVGEALDFIAETARHARDEISGLAEMLTGGPPGVALIGELVRRASATGLAVSCRFAGRCDRLAPAASEAAYRVVQESLTNALKHAPGAAVDISVRESDGTVHVRVVNAAPRHGRSGLEQSGGGHGLAGMRDRVSACGGSLAAGPTEAGGWQVSAHLPAVPVAHAVREPGNLAASNGSTLNEEPGHNSGPSAASI